MEKKVTKNYIVLSKKPTIGNKKRDIIVVKSNTQTTKSSTNMVRKTRNCSGCARKRKSG